MSRWFSVGRLLSCMKCNLTGLSCSSKIHYKFYVTTSRLYVLDSKDVWDGVNQDPRHCPTCYENKKLVTMRNLLGCQKWLQPGVRFVLVVQHQSVHTQWLSRYITSVLISTTRGCHQGKENKWTFDDELTNHLLWQAGTAGQYSQSASLKCHRWKLH